MHWLGSDSELLLDIVCQITEWHNYWYCCRESPTGNYYYSCYFVIDVTYASIFRFSGSRFVRASNGTNNVTRSYEPSEGLGH